MIERRRNYGWTFATTSDQVFILSLRMFEMWNSLYHRDTEAQSYRDELLSAELSVPCVSAVKCISRIR